MIAFSRIPPLNQQHHDEIIDLQLPLQKVIEVASIDQSKRSTTKIFKHVINNPHHLVESVKTAAKMQDETAGTVDKDGHENAQKLVAQDNVVQKIQAAENVILERQTTEFSLFPCKELPEQQSEQLIHLTSDKSPIKRLFTTPPVSQKPLPPLPSNQQKFRELSHIVFSPPTISNFNTIMFTKRPIFSKQMPLPMNRINQVQGSLVESIVKEHEERQHQKEQQRHQINENIVQNIDKFINQDQTNGESHIQCSFFNNSVTKPQQSPFHRAATYDICNSLQRTSKDSGPKQKHRHIFDKADKQTTDRELYESYHLNKNRVKQLGGKRLEDAKKTNKISLKSLRVQLTKLVNISPSVI